MRLVYLITAHKLPLQLGLLIKAIYHKDDLFVVHIDSGVSNDLDFQFGQEVKKYPNLYILPSRRTTWGGWNLVQVQLDAITFLLSADKEWDYFINISGQDFPLKSRSEMVRQLSEDPTINYVNTRKRKRLSPATWRDLFHSIRIGDQFVPTLLPSKKPKSIDHQWVGASWYILSFDFCSWLMNSNMLIEAIQFYKTIAIPDNFFIPNVIMNSPFKTTVKNDQSKAIWRFGRWHPEVLTMKNLKELLNTDKFFARKFDIEVDRRVIDELMKRTKE